MNIIVAYCKNRGIGLNGVLPWSLPRDLSRFRKLTVGNGGNAVIIGHNTWKSLPERCQPLPKRDNIVVTRSSANSVVRSSRENVFVVGDLDAAVSLCEERKYNAVWIIGGASIYRQFLERPEVGKVHVTCIDVEIACDTFFPVLPERYKLVSASDTTKECGVEYRFETYDCKDHVSS